MAEDGVTVSVDVLTAYIVSVLEALRMSRRNAAPTADLMVRTDLKRFRPLEAFTAAMDDMLQTERQRRS